MNPDLLAFQQKVSNDPALMKQLQAQTKKADFIDLAVRLGKQHGHTFTAKDVEDYLNSSASPTKTLGSQQLSSTAGGRPESYTYSKPGCQHH
jgi:predicted ribosomally synthesized peptide with nif11-like leader